MDRRVKQIWSVTVHVVRRAAIAIVGTVVVLAGVAMLVLPGPGLLTIIGGLAILALEFPFARRWLERIKELIHKALEKAKSWWRRKRPPKDPPATL
jgi:uncharacterized protein (TIGR02611 family)